MYIIGSSTPIKLSQLLFNKIEIKKLYFCNLERNSSEEVD